MFSSNPYIIPGFIALIIFVGSLLVFGRGGKKSMQARLNQLAAANPGSSAMEGQLMSLDDKSSPLAKSLEGILKMLGVNIEFQKILLQPRMAQAGFENPDVVIYYLFCKRILSIFLVIPAIFIIIQPEAKPLLKILNLVAGALIMLLGFYGFDLWIKNATLKRQQKLTRSFPDALDLLLVCVESGLALDGALSRVCRELGRAHPEITYELNRTRLELALLNDRTQALQNLAARTGLTAFKSLAATLIQTEKFGTSLTETLRVLSEDYRQTRLMVAENKAGRLPALMTVPLICLMMPAFLMIIMGPPLIRLFGEGGILDK